MSGKRIWRVTSRAVRVLFTVHLIGSNIIDYGLTMGSSMMPTIHYSGDYVLISMYNRRGRDCHCGDVVIVNKPTQIGAQVCKRISGMPGDIIQFDPSYQQQDQQDDDYNIKDLALQVPQGHCFLTGDNLSESLDSRSYQAVPLGLIRGKVIYAWKPFFNCWRPIKNNLEVV